MTVEAASPALIEKTRAAATDGTGQYRIIDLRPGTYDGTWEAGSLDGGSWLRPTSIVQPRFVRLNVTVDF